jgi:hypothetical protein
MELGKDVGLEMVKSLSIQVLVGKFMGNVVLRSHLIGWMEEIFGIFSNNPYIGKRLPLF